MEAGRHKKTRVSSTSMQTSQHLISASHGSAEGVGFWGYSLGLKATSEETLITCCGVAIYVLCSPLRSNVILSPTGKHSLGKKINLTSPKPKTSSSPDNKHPHHHHNHGHPKTKGSIFGGGFMGWCGRG